jgi:hypothetical protein
MFCRSLFVFGGVRVTPSLALYVCFVDRCLSFCTFVFTIVLSVLLRYTDSDYPFGIFKLLKRKRTKRQILLLHFVGIMIPVIFFTLARRCKGRWGVGRGSFRSYASLVPFCLLWMFEPSSLLGTVGSIDNVFDHDLSPDINLSKLDVPLWCSCFSHFSFLCSVKWIIICLCIAWTK